jgi:hypothetical protein
MLSNFFKPTKPSTPPVVQQLEQSSTPTITQYGVYYLKKNGFYIKIFVTKIIPTGNNTREFAFKININDNDNDSTNYVKKDKTTIGETFVSEYDPQTLSLKDSRIFISDEERLRDPTIDPKLIPYLNGFTISKERPEGTYVKNIQTEIYKEPQEEPKGGKANTTRKFRVSKASNIRRKNKLSKHRKIRRKVNKKTNKSNHHTRSKHNQ